MKIIHESQGIILLDCQTLAYTTNDIFSAEYRSRYIIVNKDNERIIFSHEEILILSMYFKNSQFNLF